MRYTCHWGDDAVNPAPKLQRWCVVDSLPMFDGLTPYVWRSPDTAILLSGPKDDRVIYSAAQPTGAKDTREFYESLKGVRCFWGNASFVDAAPPAVVSPTSATPKPTCGGQWVPTGIECSHGVGYFWMADGVLSFDVDVRDKRVLYSKQPPVHSPLTYTYGSQVGCGVWGDQIEKGSVGFTATKPRAAGTRIFLGHSTQEIAESSVQSAALLLQIDEARRGRFSHAAAPADSTPAAIAAPAGWPIRIQIEADWAFWEIGDSSNYALFSAHLTQAEIEAARATGGRRTKLSDAYTRAGERYLDACKTAKAAQAERRAHRTLRRAFHAWRAQCALQRGFQPLARPTRVVPTPLPTAAPACAACGGSKMRVRRVNLGALTQEICSRCPDCAVPEPAPAPAPESTDVWSRMTRGLQRLRRMDVRAARESSAASARRSFGAWKSATRVAKHSAASQQCGRKCMCHDCRAHRALAPGATIKPSPAAVIDRLFTDFVDQSSSNRLAKLLVELEKHPDNQRALTHSFAWRAREARGSPLFNQLRRAYDRLCHIYPNLPDASIVGPTSVTPPAAPTQTPPTPPPPPQDERGQLIKARLAKRAAEAELQGERVQAQRRLETIQASAAERRTEMAARIAQVEQEAALALSQDRLDAINTHNEFTRHAFRTPEAIEAEVAHAASLRTYERSVLEETQFTQECAAKRRAISAELELERLKGVRASIWSIDANAQDDERAEHFKELQAIDYSIERIARRLQAASLDADLVAAERRRAASD